MGFANTSVTDILATTIENRSKTVADNVTNNNALLDRLNKKGNIKTFSGGHKIFEELSFAENGNAGWYSGYDILPTNASDVISAAEYTIKQAAVPVVISGLEQLQNAGKEQFIDLMEARLKVAESTMSNLITGGLYSDGTGSSGKEIDGLAAALPVDPTAASYGGIDGNVYTFWQNAVSDQTAANGLDSTKIDGFWNLLWADLVRGADRPDLIMADSTVWNTYMKSLQSQQRFSNTQMGDRGFSNVKYMDADVVLDGGIYNGTVTAGAPAGTAYFINSNYMKYRPHARRNMVPLSPNKRYSTNQDAEVQIIAWAGNLTVSGRQFHGRYDANG